MRTSWLIAVALFLFYGCSDEPPQGPEPSTDVFYYRLHNQTGRVLRVDMENTRYSEAPSSRHLLTVDLVKTILKYNSYSKYKKYYLVRIYDNGTDELLVRKYLNEFDCSRDVDPSIREKEEQFYPGKNKYDCYIFLKPEDIGDDTPAG